MTFCIGRRDFPASPPAEKAAAAVAFRLLRQPSRPITPRPVAKSGRAAGMGVTADAEASDAQLPFRLVPSIRKKYPRSTSPRKSGVAFGEAVCQVKPD